MVHSGLQEDHWPLTESSGDRQACWRAVAIDLMKRGKYLILTGRTGGGTSAYERQRRSSGGSRNDSGWVQLGMSGKEHRAWEFPQIKLPLSRGLGTHCNLLWVHRLWEGVSLNKRSLGDRGMVKVKSLREETSEHSSINTLNIQSQDLGFQVAK